MMKRRMLLVVLVIALVAALIGGGTMAWFSFKTAGGEAVFAAGTVIVNADKLDGTAFEERIVNVNPGDCYCLQLNINNVGSKAVALRVTGEGTWEFDWDYVSENWEGLCFSTEFDSFAEFEAYWFEKEPEMGSEFNPVFMTNCPTSPWAFYAVSETEYYWYYTGYVGDDFGKVEAGQSVPLCLCVAFDGPIMGNIFQGATFTLSGTVEAVQWSNEAPSVLWGEGWDKVSKAGYVPYHPYFYDTETGTPVFDFTKCKLKDGSPAPCCTGV